MYKTVSTADLLAEGSDIGIIQSHRPVTHNEVIFSLGLFNSFHLVLVFLSALHFPLASPVFSHNSQNFISFNVDVVVLEENLFYLSR